MNQSVVAGDTAHQELLKREAYLFKGGQRPQEESINTTIAVIIKEAKYEQHNSAIVMFIQGKEFLNGNIYKTSVISMVQT